VKTGELTCILLSEPGSDRSIEQAVSCEAPFLFACEVQWFRSANGLGEKTLGLQRVDLGDFPSSASVDLRDLLGENLFISKLLRANDAGSSVDAVLGIKELRDAGRTRVR
jgi:hypothetical protein